MKTFAEFYRENLTLAILERITIDGVGDVDAKVDTGNAAYNVLHGTDITYDGKTVSFTTLYDKVLSKPIVDTLMVVGEDKPRPVVHFDIVVKGDKHKDVKFSIANRTENAEKCLLGIDFLKPLEVVVDTSKS